jgi:hypothetical protein
MSNQRESFAGDVLEARRAITRGLRLHLRELPPSPVVWTGFDAAAILSGPEPARDLRLAALGRLLCEQSPRTAELRALWRECLVTAAVAVRLAPRLAGDANTSAIAGLLHRLGDMLVLRAIGAAEQAAAVRLDGAGKSELCSLHGGDVLERVFRAWQVPARAATTAAEWRRLHEFPRAAADAATVYLARLLAIELISPRSCVPGMVEHAAEEAGLDPRVAAAIRQESDWTVLPGGLDATIGSTAPRSP